MSRWLGVRVDTNGSITLTFNNQDSHLPLDGLHLVEHAWTAFLISLDCNQGLVRVAIAEDASPPVMREYALPEGFRFDVMSSSNGPACGQDGHITFTNLSNGGTFLGLVRNLAVFDRMLGVVEMEAICGRDVRLPAALERDAGGLDLTRVSVTTDAPSVIQAISHSLGYEDRKIDALIDLFTSNDYLCLRHLLEDNEWYAFVTARFRGRLKAVLKNLVHSGVSTPSTMRSARSMDRGKSAEPDNPYLDSFS